MVKEVRIITIWAFFVVFSVLNSANAQNVKELMIMEGFENVSITKNDGVFKIAYENRKYRNEAQALAEVLTIAAEFADEGQVERVSVLVRQNSLPVVHLKTPIESLNKMLDSEMDYNDWTSTVSYTMGEASMESNPSKAEVFNRIRFQPVFPVGLGMRYQLGNFNNPYRFAFDLEPGIELPVGKGWSVNSTLAIPLYNNFDENRNVRPIQAALVKETAFREGVFTGISAGMFGRNRLGIHGALKAFLYEEVFSLTIQGGYTTFTDISGSVPRRELEDEDFAVYTATATYRWRPYDLDLSIQYGQFLYRDYGVRFRADRHFGEVNIGFFASITKFGENAGFHFSIPLFPKAYRNKGAFRIRPAERFPVTYRYRGNDYDARMYETGITFEEEVQELYPSFLLKEMEQYFERSSE